jgi:hypothetical protein
MSSPSIETTRKSRFDLKALLLFILIGAALYLLVQFTPLYLHKRQMEDAGAEIVQRAARQNLDLAEVKAQLHEKAREFGLPEQRQITLNREGRKVTARISYNTYIHFVGGNITWPVDIRLADLGY